MQLSIEFSSNGKNVPKIIYFQSSLFIPQSFIFNKQGLTENFMHLFNQGKSCFAKDKLIVVTTKVITKEKKFIKAFNNLNYSRLDPDRLFEGDIEFFIDEIINAHTKEKLPEIIEVLKVWHNNKLFCHFPNFPLADLDNFFQLKFPNNSTIETNFLLFDKESDFTESYPVKYSSDQEYQKVIKQIKSQILTQYSNKEN